MQSLTISCWGKGIRGKAVVIHFISSLWGKGKDEANGGLHCMCTVWINALGITQLHNWVNCDSSSVGMQSEREKLNRWKSPAGSLCLLFTASRAVLRELRRGRAWKETESGKWWKALSLYSDKQMDWTRQQRGLNNSTGGFSFYATVCQASNQLCRYPSTTTHQGTLPFLVFFASLSFPPTFQKGGQKELSLLYIRLGTFLSVGNLHYSTIVDVQDLILVAEPIPEMKYRSSTGENSRRPERVEHMRFLTSVRQSSRTLLLASKVSPPQSQLGLVFVQIIPSHHQDNNWTTNTSSSPNKRY